MKLKIHTLGLQPRCSASLTAVWLASALLFAFPRLANAQQPPPATEEPGLGDFVRLYETERSYVSRFYSVAWSEQRFDRLAQVFADWEKRLAALDFDKLTTAGRVDAVLFRTELATNRSRLELDRRRLVEMSPVLPGREVIQALELSRRRREPLDPQKAAEQLAAIPEQIKKLRKRIEEGKDKPAAKPAESAPTSASASISAPASVSASTTVPASDPASPSAATAANDAGPLTVSPVLALRTARAVGDLQRSLREWHTFYDGYQPDFDWWVRKPREALDAALNDYAKFLREQIAGVKGQEDDPLIGDPIGEVALLGDLRGEFIAYTPKELVAIAELEFKWCEDQMRAAARELGFGDDWKQALEAAKKGHVPPGQQDELILAEAKAAVDFLRSRDLITIPREVEEMWRVEMLSADAQKSLPYAVYGGQYVGVAYPTDDMSHEDKRMAMRGNNRHFMHIVTPHELIPGHHHQSYFAERYRQYRGTFSTPFFVEGWAVYWEMRLWELGYARDALDRVGMLFWRMHRCARIIVSLAFHLGDMTPTQMVDFLIERVGHERSAAMSEVRRYIGGDYSPLYQCGYMVGAIQVRALHREAVESGKLSDKQFNDTLLIRGAIPIEVIRAELGFALLSREMQPTWKFAGEPGAFKLPHP